jgi:hypothetical protein
MNLWNWFLTLIGKRFPLPPRHILTYEEIRKYWESLDDRWRVDCEIIVLRIRKASADDPRTIWRVPRLLAPATWFPTLGDVQQKLGHGESNDPFTIRIDREWEVQPGIKKKEEVCIANFEL